MSNDWAADQALQVGAELRRLRAGRSGQWLADRTAELGHRINRTTLSEVESGKRAYITTAEVAVLARALDTAPIGLVYPPPYDADVEVVPGWTMTKWHATQWFSGRSSDASAWLMAEDGDRYLVNTRALRAADRMALLERRLTQLRLLIGDVADRSARMTLVDDMADLQDELARLRAERGAPDGG